jgi:hypothetical protein
MMEANGRFSPRFIGPYARRVAKLRRAAARAVTQEQMEAIARELIEQAKSGNEAAARLVLLCVFGEPWEDVE